MSQVPSLGRRDPNSHKGTYGHAFIIGGSRGMAGAVALAGMAALRAGAGRVTIAVPDTCLETVACFDPNYMTVPVPDDGDGRMAEGAVPKLMEAAKNATSIGIGPGLSKSPAICKVVAELYEWFTGPLVADADALNALAAQPIDLSSHAGPRILTPHVGEFRRLVDENLSAAECRERAIRLAARQRVIIVLKGHRSMVTDGTSSIENETGNPGMATGGSGDVLTGIVSALAGQQLAPFDATVLGVHVHGLAGDIARDEQCGEVSLVAQDIVSHLATAFRRLSVQR